MNPLQLPKQKSHSLKQTYTRVLNNPPRDKSLTHRALLFAALAKGQSFIHFPLIAQDTLATMHSLKTLGLKVIKRKYHIQVMGNPDAFSQAKDLKLNCQNSGTTIRHLLALLAGSKGRITLTGDKSLRTRPMGRILEPLKQWGAKFQTPLKARQTLPITIDQAPILTGGVHVLKTASAQVKSALLFYALLYQKKIQLKGKLQSRNHTENFLRYLQIPFKSKNNTLQLLVPTSVPSFTTTIPADPSSTIYYLFLFNFAQNTSRKLLMAHHYYNITRCYSWIVLRKSGYSLDFIKDLVQNSVETTGTLGFELTSQKKQGIHLSSQHTSFVIDDIPLLMIWSLWLSTPSTFKNLSELQFKESNRLLEIQKIFDCFGLSKQFQQKKSLCHHTTSE